MDLDSGSKRVFQRLGGPVDPKNQKVCYHWRAGYCNRRPCPFLHRELPPPSSNVTPFKRTHGFVDDSSGFSDPRSRTNYTGSTWGRSHGGANSRTVRKPERVFKVCKYWVQGNCGYGEQCRYLHSWSLGEGFSMLTQLEGHQKVVSGIALPSGSNKLYSGSKDETVRVWDCQSGQCMRVINLGAEVGCMISEGPWVFVGMPNFVKAWNTETNTELSLSGPIGEVYAMVVGNGLLFAGTQDGSILAWTFNAATNCFEPAASLKGHTRGVVSLVVGANRLYSGSMDCTIRVWNLETLQCMQTLKEHTEVVMSVLCWDQFLLSCSLDKTIKVWVATERGNLEVTYTHNEEQGLLTLCGMHDSEAKPILLCSSNDNSVHLYDLPSFSERGKIFAKQEVRAIQMGPVGVFFTGDGTGQVKVWQWLPEPAAIAQ
ncbi:zinc finger CCCH domain-containing protein 48-like isoform X2 [Juglans microcarpa x Juglans regia]|uniref:zinc finger CCCH domain-containing protein 48-like isoform X2 n=1 Tax=Juglans microcarpa x Juglans regia TaxID=2249226 RepID=UPI001B7DC169|nr:zinc finger CCCH domain-containing protein 48-like isoform X2 [Juglans microcarpa x Juglans regia]